MSAPSMERIEKFFDCMDASGNGELTIEELYKGLNEKCGYTQSIDEVACMFLGTDTNRDMKITKDEFVKNMSMRPRNEQIKANLNLEFKKMDVDNSGFLEADEVRQLFKSLGMDLTDDEVEAYVKEGDTSGDGKVSLAELNKLLA